MTFMLIDPSIHFNLLSTMSNMPVYRQSRSGAIKISDICIDIVRYIFENFVPYFTYLKYFIFWFAVYLLPQYMF